MSDMLDQLRREAEIARAVKRNPVVAGRLKEHIESRAATHGWKPSDKTHALAEMAFAEGWVESGSVVYELTHSMAALFALTSAPRLDMKHSPHPFFVIKVPRVFFPLDNVSPSQDTWILVAHRAAMVVPDWDTTAVCSIAYPEVISTPDDLSKAYDIIPTANPNRKSGELCGRFLANTISYITEHRESFAGQPSSNGKPSPIVLRPPSDVVITKEFRDAAAAVSAAKSIVGTRRALAHVVRGHWRNQPVGPSRSERRLTWVRPHKRGDESLGKVVARIERIHASSVHASSVNASTTRSNTASSKGSS